MKGLNPNDQHNITMTRLLIPSLPPTHTGHLGVLHCAHALCLYHVAVEEAGAIASISEKGVISPGTLRQQFIDALHYLSAEDVYSKTVVKLHTQGLNPKCN